jgi:hypothetical protein
MDVPGTYREVDKTAVSGSAALAAWVVCARHLSEPPRAITQQSPTRNWLKKFRLNLAYGQGVSCSTGSAMSWAQLPGIVTLRVNHFCLPYVCGLTEPLGPDMRSPSLRTAVVIRPKTWTCTLLKNDSGATNTSERPCPLMAVVRHSPSRWPLRV